MPGVAVGVVLAAEPEDCESGPTSTRLTLPDNNQTQRGEAIRGKREVFINNLAAKGTHSIKLNSKANS